MSTSPRSTIRFLATSMLSLATALMLAACGGSDSSGSSASGEPASADTAVIRTASSDFSSGNVELVDLEAEPLSASGGYFTGKSSDLALSTYGNSYFLIERFGFDRISKRDLDNPAMNVWEYATIDEADDGSANPAQLISVDEDKGYLLRTGSDTAWIVDPDASSEADFKTGELDLSAYVPEGNEANDYPSMVAGTVVDDRLFVVMQRLDDDFSPTNDAYVAVFDTTTDEEIDTGRGGDLPGIPLEIRNPNLQGLAYQEGLGLVVDGVGARDPANPTGGIELIDPATYSSSVVVDGRDIGGVTTVDATRGYFLQYDGWANLALFPFDPSNGTVGDSIDGFAGKDLRDIATGPDGRVWIADADAGDPRVRLLDPDTNDETDDFSTELLPGGIHFAGRDED